MQEKRRPGLQADWRRGLVPMSLLIMVTLFFIRAPLWVIFIFPLWLPLYYVVYPWYLVRRWKSFESTFNAGFQRGEYKELLEVYKKQWFLRRFGPRSEMLSKLGLIYTAIERYREAEMSFESAIEAMRTNDPMLAEQLYFNLANIKYELGKYEDALQIYKSLRPSTPYYHTIRTQVALIELHRGVESQDAREFLESERLQTSGALRLRIDQALALHP